MGSQGVSDCSSTLYPARTSIVCETSRASTPKAPPATFCTTISSGRPDGPRVYTDMRSSKQGREIHCCKPRLTLLTRLTSQNVPLSDLGRRNCCFAGKVRRDPKDVMDCSSETDRSRRVRRCNSCVLWRVEAAVSWGGRVETGLADLGNRGTFGRCSRGGAENVGASAHAVNEWRYA